MHPNAVIVLNDGCFQVKEGTGILHSQARSSMNWLEAVQGSPKVLNAG